MAKKITLLDVKQALRDERFRKSLPPELDDLVRKYNQNRACPCNTKLYGRILRDCKEQVAKYFPNRELPNIDEEISKLSENHWTVISCHINDLEKKLRKLPPGRKQLDVARWEDQVTVVINELDILY
jgi:hypothetical protein